VIVGGPLIAQEESRPETCLSSDDEDFSIAESVAPVIAAAIGTPVVMMVAVTRRVIPVVMMKRFESDNRTSGQ